MLACRRHQQARRQHAPNRSENPRAQAWRPNRQAFRRRRAAIVNHAGRREAMALRLSARRPSKSACCWRLYPATWLRQAREEAERLLGEGQDPAVARKLPRQDAARGEASPDHGQNRMAAVPRSPGHRAARCALREARNMQDGIVIKVPSPAFGKFLRLFYYASPGLGEGFERSGFLRFSRLQFMQPCRQGVARLAAQVMESYRIPSDLRGRPTTGAGAPPSLRPVSRDRTDFSAGRPKESQFLVAIASA